jgi:hypothetical protein
MNGGPKPKFFFAVKRNLEKDGEHLFHGDSAKLWEHLFNLHTIVLDMNQKIHSLLTEITEKLGKLESSIAQDETEK